MGIGIYNIQNIPNWYIPEALLNEEHKITQSMKAGIALETIVADQKLTNKWWILNLLLWSLLFLSVPILVILNIFHLI